MLVKSRMPGINMSLLLKYYSDEKWLGIMFGAVVPWLILSDRKHLMYDVLVWCH